MLHRLSRWAGATWRSAPCILRQWAEVARYEIRMEMLRQEHPEPPSKEHWITIPCAPSFAAPSMPGPVLTPSAWSSVNPVVTGQRITPETTVASKSTPSTPGASAAT